MDTSKTQILPSGMVALMALVSTITGTSALAAIPVSQSAFPDAVGAGSSFAGTISADGNMVIYLSDAKNLVSDRDRHPVLDVFARDLQLGTTALVSSSSDGSGGGNGNSINPSVSSNGQWIAFQSGASNLVLNDSNGADDVYVRNLAEGKTVLVSERAASPQISARGNSRRPQISGSGRYVVFESDASDLVAQDVNGTNDVFIRDLQSRITRMVSASTNGQSGNGPSRSPSVSYNGRYVAFLSSAQDIVGGTRNSSGEVFVRDTELGQTVWASATMGEFFDSPYKCFDPVVSEDGRAVAFKAAPANSDNSSSALLDSPANSDTAREQFTRENGATDKRQRLICRL